MKRFLAGAALAFSSALAIAATLSPVQLLNPAGSTAGQAIVSSGPSTAPAWGAVSAGSLAPVAANTVLGNFTGSTAAPASFAVPSCSTANSALKYTTGTGLSCGTTFALTSGNLSQFASTTSAQLLGVLSDETGSGAAVFGTSPSLTTPTIAGATLSGTLAGTPTFSGNVAFSAAPTATTAAVGTNTTQIATTAFVQAAVGKPYFQVTTSANQSITVATPTKVTFNTVALDSGTFFSTVNNRFQPTVAGKYRVSVRLSLQASTTGANDGLGVAYVYKNGANACENSDNYPVQSAATIFPSPDVSCIVTLNGASDYIEAWAFVNGNSAGQVNTSTTKTAFEGEYIGQ